MKNKSLILFAIVFILVTLPTISFAQQDTIDVPQEWEGSQFGVVNRFIMSDTSASGGRAHPNAVYRLERDGYYDIDHPMPVDFNITLIANHEPSSKRPPMISRGVDAQGEYISGLINIRGDSTYFKSKNIMFNGVRDDNTIVNRGGSLFGITGTYHRLEMDNCIFTGWGGNLMNARDEDRSTKIFTNCIFRNGVDLDNPWSGNIYSITTKTAYQDTIKFINNTFFNTSSYQLLSWDFIDYLEYSHNTLFNSTINAHWAPYLQNAKINNNIFFNYQTVGETQYETENGYWDKDGNGNHRSSICKLNKMDPQLLLDHGMSEADRKVEYKNNVYFWSQALKDYWTTHKDSANGVEMDILPTLWMNDFTKAMFDDASAYPYLVEENNDELDPGFDATLVDAVIAKEIPFVKLYRRYGYGAMVDPQERHYAPDGNFWDVAWPLPENLTYTNATVLTHADGFPAGDLNWYPSEKTRWLTDIEEVNSSIPNDYNLSQNYPNPFNPSTVINFNIPNAGVTKLAVYNILGQEVVILVNKQLSAGSYKYKFDASNLTSGIYFYKLQSNNHTEIKKMMLIK